METLLSQNQQLSKNIENCMEEIEKQKRLNEQHQNQIETLLNFNQRLLTIIQTELVNGKKETLSLNPISERSERESETFAPIALQSFIKERKLTVKSEWGGPTKESLIDRAHFGDTKKLKLFDNAFEQQSIKNEQEQTLEKSQQISIVTVLQKKLSEGDSMKSEMQQYIRELREYKNEGNTFYNKKINEIKQLNNKLANFHPLNELTKITDKMNLSQNTTNLIRMRMMK